ncbi:hypothetical protein KC571_03485, partial [candidate division WWE3 bacterium]|nr:hypothetical protein [candidate division WWE3 bacterium]
YTWSVNAIATPEGAVISYDPAPNGDWSEATAYDVTVTAEWFDADGNLIHTESKVVHVEQPEICVQPETGECTRMSVDGNVVTLSLAGDLSQVERVEVQDENGNVWSAGPAASVTLTIPGAEDKTLSTYFVMKDGGGRVGQDLCTNEPTTTSSCIPDGFAPVRITVFHNGSPIEHQIVQLIVENGGTYEGESLHDGKIQFNVRQSDWQKNSHLLWVRDNRPDQEPITWTDITYNYVETSLFGFWECALAEGEVHLGIPDTPQDGGDNDSGCAGDCPEVPVCENEWLKTVDEPTISVTLYGDWRGPRYYLLANFDMGHKSMNTGINNEYWVLYGLTEAEVDDIIADFPEEDVRISYNGNQCSTCVLDWGTKHTDEGDWIFMSYGIYTQNLKHILMVQMGYDGAEANLIAAEIMTQFMSGKNGNGDQGWFNLNSLEWGNPFQS